MDYTAKSPAAVAELLGQRLKQARLNLDLTQLEVAERAGVGRKAVMNAEKGKVQLEALVAILQALDLTTQLDNFLPPQPPSPVQLAKLQGKQRQRASGQHKQEGDQDTDEDTTAW
ncbi:helix-turn-helix transcriptional regulator [Microbulbifer agarilyticus]|uniref:helix-turn-helix transcriptional regulator n=1 Tax=Microbulbifer agarilyticus TaxID=260552 RepID=UPI000255B762|nr:helix-turn-helix transcriptional regulator [Microbulbifer agarilyticus]MCA0894594.1 helix-turn-helix domain-containing protein [Microbulbifer agarilyticus]MCA0902033.1 helix-turn-helix domain-containing protein [Microbulbifer agarilyticus]